MRLVARLEDGLRDFLAAVRETPVRQATSRPCAGGWSVVECVEHVAAVEKRYVDWILGGSAIPPAADSDKELRLFSTVRNRLAKVDAPEAVRPRGRFRTLDAATREFERVRGLSIELTRERGEGLYALRVRHPYFGDLNGAEIVHLIDAHARRHADQIREMRENLPAPAPPKMRSTRQAKAAFRRDPPDLPADLNTDAAAAHLFSDGEFAVLQDVRIEGYHGAGLKAKTFRAEGCSLERVQLPGSEFGSVVWKDVRLVGCDLANIRAHRMELVRVELIDCRLTGLASSAANWRDVLVATGDVRFAQLHDGVFRNCEFDRCQAEDAELANADLAGCVFRSCSLARADLHGATLNETDFRGSDLEGMLVGAADVRGAIVDPAQALVLSRLLGLQIR